MTPSTSYVAISVGPDATAVRALTSDGRDLFSELHGNPYKASGLIQCRIEDGELPTPVLCGYGIGEVGFGLKRQLEETPGVSCICMRNPQAGVSEILSDLEAGCGALAIDDPGRVSDRDEFVSLGDLLEYRMAYLEERSFLIGLLRSIYARFGIKPPCPVRCDEGFFSWAGEVHLPDAFADETHSILLRELQLADNACRNSDSRLRWAIGSSTEPGGWARRSYLAHCLTRIVGIGLTTATKIVGEIENPREYRSGEALANEADLVPNPLNGEEYEFYCWGISLNPLQELFLSTARTAIGFIGHPTGVKKGSPPYPIPAIALREANRFGSWVRNLFVSPPPDGSDWHGFRSGDVRMGVAWELAKTVWGVLCLADDAFELGVLRSKRSWMPGVIDRGHSAMR